MRRIKASYEPITDILDRGSALYQSSTAIDVVMALAVECNDIEAIKWCVGAWMELSDRLVDAPEEEEETEIIGHEDEPKHMIGFSANGHGGKNGRN